MVTKTTATPLTMRGVRGAYFLALRKQMAATIHRMMASVFPTDQPYEEYPWLHESPMPTPWEGERTIQRLKGEKITIVNSEWETTIGFKKRDFTRDKTSQMRARVMDLATNVAAFPTKLMTELILANGNAYDGKAYFATDHVIGKSGTINNAIAAAQGLVKSGTRATIAEQAENLLICLEHMLGWKNSQGEPLNETAREFACMVPPALLGATIGAISASFTSNGATNPLGEMLAHGYKIVPVANARLTNPEEFYFSRIDAGIKPWIVQEEDVVPVEFDLDSEHCKKTNEVAFGHGWAGGVGYGRFELALRATLPSS